MKPYAQFKSLLLVGALVLWGCASPTDESDDPKISIDGVGWSIDNIDPD